MDVVDSVVVVAVDDVVFRVVDVDVDEVVWTGLDIVAIVVAVVVVEVVFEDSFNFVPRPIWSGRLQHMQPESRKTGNNAYIALILLIEGFLGF